MHVYMYIRMYACVHIRVFVRIYVCMCAYIRLFVYMNKGVSAFMLHRQIPTVPTASQDLDPANSTFWQILSGSRHCQVAEGGRCVTDGPGDYGNNERCTVGALRPLTVTAEQYEVETGWDYVTINGVTYERSGPQAVRMNEGGMWSWRSDGSGMRGGFKLCASAINQTNAGKTMT